MYLKFPGSRTPRKESVKSMWWYANIRKNLKRYVYTKQTFNMGLYLKNMGNNEINYQKLTQYTQKTSKKYLLMSKVF